MSSFSVCSRDPAGNGAVFSMIYLMGLHLCSGIWNRNATATPRTRHAQLLLPLSRRSGTDHAAAWMVSSKETKEVDSYKRGAVAIFCPWRRRRRDRERPLWTEWCPPMKGTYEGGRAGGCSSTVAGGASLRVPSTCQTHDSKRAPAYPYGCLRPPIKVLWAPCAN